MGVVWLAHDRLVDREVAVREITFPETLPQDERDSLRARVLRETRAAERLNHPGAITLHFVLEEQGRAFVVMELITAPSLAELVARRGLLPPEQVARIGLQIASVLEAAHRVGIVHRDVKPANVMVAEDGDGLWLADFGIAQLQGDPQLTASGILVGSPAYMAPEQASGSGSGPETDQWGLGATLYYAVEGSPPFQRADTIATLAAVVNDPPRPPQRAGALGPVVLSLLAKDPATRPALRQVRIRLARIADASREPAASAPAPAPAEPQPAEPQPAEPQPAEPPAQLEAPSKQQSKQPKQQPKQEPVVAAAGAAGAAASSTSRSWSRRRLVALAMLAGVAAVLLVLVAALGSHQRSGGTSGGTSGGHGPQVTGPGAEVASTGAGSTPATRRVAPAAPPTTAAHGTAPASTAGTATTPVRFTQALAFDPLGDGHENDDQARLAIDQNPTSAWSTQHYNRPALGGLKPGVGLVLDAGHPVAARELDLTLLVAGGNLQVYGAAGDAHPPGFPDGWTRLATVPDLTSRQQRIALTGEGSFRWYLVWFTSLPPAPDDPSRYQNGIAEALLGPSF
jgi:hypothetical protein